LRYLQADSDESTAGLRNVLLHSKLRRWTRFEKEEYVHRFPACNSVVFGRLIFCLEGIYFSRCMEPEDPMLRLKLSICGRAWGRAVKGFPGTLFIFQIWRQKSFSCKSLHSCICFVIWDYV